MAVTQPVFRATYTTASGSLSFNLSASDATAARSIAEGYLTERPRIAWVGADGNQIASVDSGDVDSVVIDLQPSGAHTDSVHVEDDRIRLG